MYPRGEETGDDENKVFFQPLLNESSPHGGISACTDDVTEIRQ
jgi:hypothetical protein